MRPKVNFADRKKKNLSELTIEDIKKVYSKMPDKALNIINIKNSVNSKKSYGGTSFDNIKKMIQKNKKELRN